MKRASLHSAADLPVVKLYAGLRQAAGIARLELPGRTVGEVIQALCRRYPVLEDKILEAGALRPQVIVSLNGHHIALAESLDTRVAPGDEIAIFPPIAGG